MRGPRVRLGILLAAAGSSGPEALRTYEAVRRGVQAAFPEADVGWVYTSEPIRRKLAAQGYAAEAIPHALARLADGGVEEVVVRPLHLSEGREYQDLMLEIQACRAGQSPFRRIVVGRPLMLEEAVWRGMLECVVASVAGLRRDHEGIVLVAHGSLEPGSLEPTVRAGMLCRLVDPLLFMGMILGQPSVAEVLASCRAASVRRVWVLPAMVAAGRSAETEIFGVGPESWCRRLERAGVACVEVRRGWGDLDGMVEVWARSIAVLVGSEERAVS